MTSACSRRASWVPRAASSASIGRRKRSRRLAAGRRLRASGNVEYQLASIEAFLDSDTFDAMIGRFVLMYSADPATALERLLTLVKPGGIVAFLEMDMVAARTGAAWSRSWPPSWTGCARPFAGEASEIDLASQVWRIFQSCRAYGFGNDRAVEGGGRASALRVRCMSPRR